MSPFPFGKTYRSAQRLRQIINVFIKHGFGRFVEQLNLQRYIPFRKRLRTFGVPTPPPRHLTDAERLRMAFEELGPSFIKLAQLLASRPDLITEDYASEFRKLQDEVPPFPADVARAIFVEETGVPVDDVFRVFNDVPIAAASIAQVHRGELRDGTEVVAKIQRPHIRETIEEDIRIFRIIARLMLRYIPEAAFFNPEAVVDEFARTIRKEMDFVEEGRNICRFRRNFADDPDVLIPGTFAELMSERVIVMEYIEGVRIDDIKAIEARGHDRRRLADAGVSAYFKQILEHGFFHADPHPGNILVTPAGTIAFLDFGQVGRVSDALKESIASLLMALLKKDFDRIIDEYIEMGIVPHEVNLEEFRREFLRDLSDFMEPLYGLTLKELDFASYLNTLTSLALKHRLKLPPEILMVNKTMLVLEGLGSRLDPNFDFIQAAEPYAAKLMRDRFDPKRLCDRTRKNIDDLGDFVVMFPKQVRQLVQKMLRDDFAMRLRHEGLDRFIRDFDRSSNRIAFSMIVAALLLSSAIMHASDVGPTIHGVSVLGASAFFIAFVMGVWLLISIIRSGRL